MGDSVEDRDWSFAGKLKLLLTQFPHPEGRPWRGTEIEVETRGLVSQQYFSMIRTGNLRRPGLEQLVAIADVMGFPFELWRAEPEQWPKILDEKISQNRRFQNGKELAKKFELMRAAVIDSRTNRPFTDQEISRKSKGLLTVDNIREIQAGKVNVGALTYDQISALSQVFGVTYEYWTEPIEGEWPRLAPDVVDALRSEGNQLLLNRTRNLSNARKNVLVIMAEQLGKVEDEHRSIG